jgi:hypothetical protein
MTRDRLGSRSLTGIASSHAAPAAAMTGTLSDTSIGDADDISIGDLHLNVGERALC